MDPATLVLDALRRAAPERDPAAVDPDDELTDALDLDSVGFVRFAEALGAAAGVPIPVRDYPELLTARRATGYLARRLAGQNGGW